MDKKTLETTLEMSKTAKIGDEDVVLHCDDILSSIRTRDDVSEIDFNVNEFDFSTLQDGGAKGLCFGKDRRFVL